MRLDLRYRFLAAVTFLLAASAVCEAQAPAIPENVKESIRARVDHDNNVSIVVGIVNPDGSRYFAYGKTAFPDGDTPDEDAVFEIGSITKVFTSLLLADMVERGEVALDDPIEKYLPKFSWGPYAERTVHYAGGFGDPDFGSSQNARQLRTG